MGGGATVIAIERAFDVSRAIVERLLSPF